MAVRPYKRKGVIQSNKWMVDYYDSKKARQRLIYVGTRAEADAAEADLRKQHGSGPLKNPTINAILPEYLTWMRNHRAVKTVKDIELTLKKLQPHFGHYPVNRITRSLIEDYISLRKKAGRVTAQGKRIGEIKPSGINKELAYLSSIISWMVEQEYSYPLPFKIKKLKSRRPLPQIPTPAKIEAFLSALGKHDPMQEALAGILYDNGLRWSEAANLRWEMINWESGSINVKGKGDKERMAFLSDRCRRLLSPAWAKAGKGEASGWIFPSPVTGEPYSNQKKAWATAGRLAGVKINPHLLRHAYATFTLEATGDLRAVQVELDHASSRTTEIYTHISQARRREINQQRQEYLDKAKREYDQDKIAAQPGNDNSAQVIDISRHLKTNK